MTDPNKLTHEESEAIRPKLSILRLCVFVCLFVMIRERRLFHHVHELRCARQYKESQVIMNEHTFISLEEWERSDRGGAETFMGIIIQRSMK